MCIRQCQTSLISSYLCLVSITPCFHLRILKPHVGERKTEPLDSLAAEEFPLHTFYWFECFIQLRPDQTSCPVSKRVKQDHLHSIIPFAVDRTEPASVGSHDFTHSKPSVRQRLWTIFSENDVRKWADRVQQRPSCPQLKPQAPTGLSLLFETKRKLCYIYSQVTKWSLSVCYHLLLMPFKCHLIPELTQCITYLFNGNKCFLTITSIYHCWFCNLHAIPRITMQYRTIWRSVIFNFTHNFWQIRQHPWPAWPAQHYL